MVISGPSGVGKGSLIRLLRDRRPDLHLSVSATTRPPRPGETHDVDYDFVSPARFQEMVEAGELLEWAEVYGERYGTPLKPVSELRRSGRLVLLELDVQGARTVKDRVPEAVLVFVAPPSHDELVRRLSARGTERGDALERRLAHVEGEMAEAARFDHIVVNEDLDRATAEVEAILGLSRPDEQERSTP